MLDSVARGNLAAANPVIAEADWNKKVISDCSGVSAPEPWEPGDQPVALTDFTNREADLKMQELRYAIEFDTELDKFYRVQVLHLFEPEDTGEADQVELHRVYHVRGTGSRVTVAEDEMCIEPPVEEGKTAPFIVKITFQENSACSGFDPTTVPAWLMVPLPAGDNNTAKVAIAPPQITEHVDFVSANQQLAVVAPAKPTSSLQSITVTSVGEGSTEISARIKGVTYSALRVDVVELVSKTVRIFSIAAEGGLPPTNVPSAEALQAYLNECTWGRQANAYFTVLRSDVQVDYDIDEDGMLDDPDLSSPAEMDAVSNALRDSTVDYNLYYVKTAQFYAIADRSRGEAWLDDDPDPSVLLSTSAHEIGHLLGREGHGGEYGVDPMAAGYTTANPCRIRKVDWEMVER